MPFPDLKMFRVLAAAAFIAVGPAAAAEVDLELVLAVDVSRSMDLDEHAVQRNGYVEAFRHPDVLNAIASGMTGRIAVTYLEWSGSATGTVVAPWTVIDGHGSAEAFAATLAAAPIQRLHGTSISNALNQASALFDESPYQSHRRVIDVSGDGPNNMGPAVLSARDAVLARGIVINGLPIMLKAPDGLYSIRNLDEYYADCVIGGPGAFLVPVRAIEGFAEAIRRKLVLEIAGWQPMLMLAADTGRRQAVDCMVGERLRRMWMDQ